MFRVLLRNFCEQTFESLESLKKDIGSSSERDFIVCKVWALGTYSAISKHDRARVSRRFVCVLGVRAWSVRRAPVRLEIQRPL